MARESHALGLPRPRTVHQTIKTAVTRETTMNLTNLAIVPVVPVNPFAQPAARPDVRPVLDAVIRAHRPQLVTLARQHLRSCRTTPDDVVQTVCLHALLGRFELSLDPVKALEDMKRAVVARCCHKPGRRP
jgi:hypothetical protein